MADGKVVGIGAVFLRADDPERQAAWYRDTLGIAATEPGKATPDGSYSWDAAGGEMVFTFVPRASSDFALINLKVSGIDALIERLRGIGVAVETNPEWDHPSVGRFARIADPEGNAVELWEPPVE
ncbi:MAG TPA: VOC family protein [Croceibacterium sp.]|jgi:predicted enzyme related to lactoylglutathione lyase